jgi:uncharacterized protein YoxC
MPLYVHLIHESDTWLRQRLDSLYTQNELIIHNQEAIMATLDQVLADVTNESAGIDSLGVLITQLGEQVKGLTSGNLPPYVQAKVDAIFTQAEANKAKINAAINAAPGSNPPTVAAPLPVIPATPTVTGTVTAGPTVTSSPLPSFMTPGAAPSAPPSSTSGT